MIMEILPGIAILLAMIYGGMRQRAREKCEWNNGICATSGQPWIHFDCDFHGARGYEDGCGNWLWVSYRVDSAADRREKRKIKN